MDTMVHEITKLEPRAVWQHFAELNAVPRPSKKEDRVVAFMLEFGRSLGLETQKDETGNVIIRKPATPGMEGRAPIVLQGHLDMVHQKNADTDFDFDTQGIESWVDGDWVRAHGTTLGADNGIGVASTMAILASSDIPHPAIEALFTVDEETGMTGAMGLKGGLLSGDILLNLDTEDDQEITIGCAGGVDVTARGEYETEATAPGNAAFVLKVSGLTGGHSGMDIHLGRANANKVLNRLLLEAADVGARIASIDSGGLRNAIPREGSATIVVGPAKEVEFRQRLEERITDLRQEFSATDPGLAVALEPTEAPDHIVSEAFQQEWLQAVEGCLNGVYRMSPDIDGLVQTSNNLARVKLAGGKYEVMCLTRGSVDAEKLELARSLAATFEKIGARVALTGAYPGWAPKPDAPIVKILSELYEERFGSEAKVMACHAGLECGILGSNYPDMQMISFGPNIRGAHSPDEKVQVSSVQKFWGLLLELLKRIPEA